MIKEKRGTIHEASPACHAVRKRTSVTVHVHPCRQSQCADLYPSAHLAQSRRGLDRPTNLRGFRCQPQHLHSCAPVVSGGGNGGSTERQAPTAISPGLDRGTGGHLIAITCSPAPTGHDHWTVRLLAGKAVELGFVESISPETIRQLLKKTNSNPGNTSSGASQP